MTAAENWLEYEVDIKPGQLTGVVQTAWRHDRGIADPLGAGARLTCQAAVFALPSRPALLLRLRGGTKGPRSRPC